MRPDPLHGLRRAGLGNLGADVRFIFSEAVADHPSAGRLLLPDGNPKISGRERPAHRIEVDHVAGGIDTKAVFSWLKSLKGRFGQERLHRQFVDRRSLRPACRASEGRSSIGRAGAAVGDHLDYEYQPWSELQGQAICSSAGRRVFMGAVTQERHRGQTWTGQISDSMCGAKHTMKSMTDRACTEMCVKSKGKYVFVTGEKVYQITDQNDKALATHAGHTVVLSGAMKGDTVTVSKIDMPKK